jgi:DNA-directed RNA polymerase alpha subunit
VIHLAEFSSEIKGTIIIEDCYLFPEGWEMNFKIDEKDFKKLKEMCKRVEIVLEHSPETAMVNINKFVFDEYSFDIPVPKRTRIANCLNHHYDTNYGMIDLNDISELELMEIHKFGRGSLDILKRMMEEKGYKMRP